MDSPLSIRSFFLLFVGLIAIADRASDSVQAVETQSLNQRIDAITSRGIDFLKNRGQADDGSFSSQSGVAVTALCVDAILENRPAAIDDPAVKKAIQFIESRIQTDGGIYTPDSSHRNYETCVAVGALVQANRDGKYDSILKRAEAFLKEIQWDEGEGAKPSDTAYGGAGYGSHKRPDLSNTAFFMEALKELGNDADDEAVKRALKFVVRSQNLAGHGNDTEHADDVNDGGFYYTPAAGGESQAGKTDSGALRSYGSMTYAGLKSMIYAGMKSDDPRVQAAMSFIRKTYTLESNPGMGAMGLYYYYHTFAKSLDISGIDVIDDTNGDAHNWREELVTLLAKLQQSDGSWVNDQSSRWMEGDRQLVTAYALLALARCKQP
jgi:squalene-hopene/tetraprenyl-beta-curcumene cyclase